MIYILPRFSIDVDLSGCYDVIIINIFIKTFVTRSRSTDDVAIVSTDIFLLNDTLRLRRAITASTLGVSRASSIGRNTNKWCLW